MNKARNLRGDRQKSLQAGLWAAFGALMAFGLVRILPAWQAGAIAPLLLCEEGFALGVSGFLFGVTYRYATTSKLDPSLADAEPTPQETPNLQLQAGVILAFALVRGLGQVEVLALPIPWPPEDRADFLATLLALGGHLSHSLWPFVGAWLGLKVKKQISIWSPE